MTLVGFIGTLVFFAGIWHLRRTDFGKAMIVLLALCATCLIVLLTIYH